MRNLLLWRDLYKVDCTLQRFSPLTPLASPFLRNVSHDNGSSRNDHKNWRKAFDDNNNSNRSSSDSNHDYTRQQHLNRRTSPYQILGVTPNTPMDQVKRAFAKLALQKHPDHNGRKNDNSQPSSYQDFIQLQQAYEYIRQKRKQLDNDSYDNDYNFDDGNDTGYWYDSDSNSNSSDDDNNIPPTSFHFNTSRHVPFAMSEKTRQEIIHAYKTSKEGDKDLGGYWDMARIMTEQQARQPLPVPKAQIEPGKALRRKRR